MPWSKLPFVLPAKPCRYYLPAFLVLVLDVFDIVGLDFVFLFVVESSFAVLALRFPAMTLGLWACAMSDGEQRTSPVNMSQNRRSRRLERANTRSVMADIGISANGGAACMDLGL